MKKTHFTYLMAISSFGLHAQNAAVASGGDAVGTGGSSSYSVGQVFYQRPIGDGFSISQGNQQPFEIVVLNTPNFTPNPQMTIYPNPVYSGFYIAFPDFDTEPSTFVLSDISGKTIQKGTLTSKETLVNIESLTPGVYLLQVSSRAKVNGYKIIKQ